MFSDQSNREKLFHEKNKRPLGSFEDYMEGTSCSEGRALSWVSLNLDVVKSFFIK